ncbi:MAG: Smr/MutS family protein [Anditalea sp.]
MNIGDKVRLLHGNEEGTITKISSGGRIEVEIEDGFRIPAMKNEIVVISESERQYFGDGKMAEPKTTPSFKASSHTTEGLFLGYIPLNDKEHSVYFINNTEKDFAFAIAELFGENSRTLLAGLSAARSHNKLDEKSIVKFEEWPPLYLQFIPVNSRIEKAQPAFQKRVKFKASTFFRSKGKIPVLDKEGYFFKIDQQEKELNVRQLNKELNEEKEVEIHREQFHRPEKEIDLHIEKLTADYDLMSNSEMLKLQMEIFEKNLNYAMATGMDEISFIHGIGNGVLKKEIHKYLSQLDNIKYFQDTQKSRFGYGATLVRIN